MLSPGGGGFAEGGVNGPFESFLASEKSKYWLARAFPKDLDFR